MELMNDCLFHYYRPDGVITGIHLIRLLFQGTGDYDVIWINNHSQNIIIHIASKPMATIIIRNTEIRYKSHQEDII